MKQRRDADFKLFHHVQQLTHEEYELQKEQATRQELAKLKESQEYNMMLQIKGQSMENWNW